MRLAVLLLAPILLTGCIEPEPTPSEQLGIDLQRTGEAAVADIDTTGFDLLE